jgi:hypothetical protein
MLAGASINFLSGYIRALSFKRSFSFLFCLFFCVLVWTQGFALATKILYHLSHTSSPLCSGYFGDGVLGTICLGWPQTTILPISASQISRNTGIFFLREIYNICKEVNYGFCDGFPVARKRLKCGCGVWVADDKWVSDSIGCMRCRTAAIAWDSWWLCLAVAIAVLLTYVRG